MIFFFFCLTAILVTNLLKHARGLCIIVKTILWLTFPACAGWHVTETACWETGSVVSWAKWLIETALLCEKGQIIYLKTSVNFSPLIPCIYPARRYSSPISASYTTHPFPDQFIWHSSPCMTYISEILSNSMYL